MKHLWKYLMCTALCLCLLFSAALAEAVDINLHVMTDYTDADAWTVRSGQVVGANQPVWRLERWAGPAGTLERRNERAGNRAGRAAQLPE